MNSRLLAVFSSIGMLGVTALLLLLPAPASAAENPAPAPAAVAIEQATVEAGALEGPGSVAQPEALRPCSPPPFGNWWVGSSCRLSGSHSAAGSVYVVGSSTLELAPGATLDIDFSQRHLWIGDGSRVVIGVGARVQ